MARIQSLTTIPSVSNTDVLAIEHNTGTGTYKIPISMLLSDVYSKSEAVAKTDIVDNLTSTATDKPGSANMLKTLNDSKVSCTELISVSNMSEGATYTFPDSIKNSKIVVISFRRYGYFASMAASYFALNNGASNGTIVFADNSVRYITFKVVSGVLTILHDGLGSPTMEIMGIG